MSLPYLCEGVQASQLSLSPFGIWDACSSDSFPRALRCLVGLPFALLAVSSVP